ncbi:MAG: nucleoside hydrolase [Pseudomonadota bacterium]
MVSALASGQDYAAARDLILDTDGGVDDAQALLMLLANGRPPSAITTVFGNVSRNQATRNMLDVLALAKADIPVYPGASRALVADPVDAKHVHGEDGLGGVARPQSGHQAKDLPAPEFLISALRGAIAAGGRVDVLMIGPLTNLALVLRAAPDCLEGIGQLTIMGGTINGRGNTTPAAEFNIFADPEAAEIVLGCGAHTVLAPWETCYEHFLSGDEMDKMVETANLSPSGRMFRDLCSRSRAVVESYIGEDRLPMIDPLAAAAVLDPGIVAETLSASVQVALAPGLTRGMTVVDPSGRLDAPKIDLIQAADMTRIARLIVRTLETHTEN